MIRVFQLTTYDQIRTPCPSTFGYIRQFIDSEGKQTWDHPMKMIREHFPDEEWPPLDQEVLPEKYSIINMDLPGYEIEQEKKKYIWNPHPELPLKDYHIYHCLIERIQRIQNLMDDTNDKDILFDLRMWQDAHMNLSHYYQNNVIEKCTDQHVIDEWNDLCPDVSRSFHEGQLPDILEIIPQCNFWKQTIKQKNQGENKSIIWLLSKSLPWRCTVRAMKNTFTQDCVPNHPRIYDLVWYFFTCSMLGGYKHCNYVPDFVTRLEIYGIMIINRVSKDFMLTHWFSDANNQVVLQNITREFMIYGMTQIPALREFMVNKHRWDLIETNSHKAMDNFRKHINDSNKKKFGDWFVNIKDILIDFDEHHPKNHDIEENPGLFVDKMAKQCASFDDDVFCKPEYRSKRFSEEDSMALKQMIMRTPIDYIPWFLLAEQEPNYETCLYKDETGSWEQVIVDMNKNPFETDKRKLTRLLDIMYDFYIDHDTKRIKPYLKSLTVYEYQKISAFFYFLNQKQTARLVLLPMNYYEYQLEALCKKNHVTCAENIPEGSGMYYYSINCGFKGFLVPIKSDKEKTDNLNANGSMDTMFCSESKTVVCFHKINKSKRRKQNPKRRTTMDMFSKDQINPKKQSKDNRKQKESELCSTTPLNKLSLIGFGLECQDGFIVLCCNCANPTLFDLNKFLGDKFVCTRCTDNDNLYNEKTCFNCMKYQKDMVDPFKTIEVLDDVRSNTPEFSTINLCKKCQNKSIMKLGDRITLSTIIQGFREKWKNNSTSKRSKKKKQSIASDSLHKNKSIMKMVDSI